MAWVFKLIEEVLNTVVLFDHMKTQISTSLTQKTDNAQNEMYALSSWILSLGICVLLEQSGTEIRVVRAIFALSQVFKIDIVIFWMPRVEHE